MSSGAFEDISGTDTVKSVEKLSFYFQFEF